MRLFASFDVAADYLPFSDLLSEVEGVLRGVDPTATVDGDEFGPAGGNPEVRVSFRPTALPAFLLYASRGKLSLSFFASDAPGDSLPIEIETALRAIGAEEGSYSVEGDADSYSVYFY